MIFFFFTVLILLNHEHRRSFHLLISSPISFFKDLKFLSYRSLTCLVRVKPKYFFILFEVIVKGVVSLISFLIYLSFVYRRNTDLCELILYQILCWVCLSVVGVPQWNCLGMYTYIHYYIICNKDTFISSFPNCIPLISSVVLLF